MAAGTHNFFCEQGATFSRVLTYKDSGGSPIDLTNYTGKMQVRTKNVKSVVIEFNTAGGVDGEMTLGGVAGTITLVASATVTAALKAGEYIYDLELTDSSNNVDRVVQGTFTVDAEVTK